MSAPQITPAQIRQAATFNSTPYVITAIIFLLLTIPMARLVDWLVRRERSGGARLRGNRT